MMQTPVLKLDLRPALQIVFTRKIDNKVPESQVPSKSFKDTYVENQK